MYPILIGFLLLIHPQQAEESPNQDHHWSGRPQTIDSRYASNIEGLEDITILTRDGFEIGHFNRLKTPLWVSYRWQKEQLKKSTSIRSKNRNYQSDRELPKEARASSDYKFRTSGQTRGHMLRRYDSFGWGRENASYADRMSNICPQSSKLNGGLWLKLEEYHRNLVIDPKLKVETVWVVCGPIFEDGKPTKTISNDIGVPKGFYKILIWKSPERGQSGVLPFIFKQMDTDGEIADYLVTIDEIEKQTGLDFFSELEDGLEEKLESYLPATLIE